MKYIVLYTDAEGKPVVTRCNELLEVISELERIAEELCVLIHVCRIDPAFQS